jgi:hypothetical protein
VRIPKASRNETADAKRLARSALECDASSDRFPKFRMLHVEPPLNIRSSTVSIGNNDFYERALDFCRWNSRWLDVVVEHGKIAEIAARSLAHRKHEIIDLNGNYLAPGFIDVHVHGALDRDTMEASAEAFRAVCDFHATGGTTSLLLTTATAPVDAIIKVLEVGSRLSPRRLARLPVFMLKGHSFQR